MSSSVETGRITTDIPARMDRLPWARWHWLVVIGLGTVWILDGLEVTIVGSMSEALKDPNTGLGLTSSDIGVAGAVYVAGACIGALFFGQLTDRFGRKKLFLITLAVYTAATVATAFAPNAAWYFAARFLTGAGMPVNDPVSGMPHTFHDLLDRQEKLDLAANMSCKVHVDFPLEELFFERVVHRRIGSVIVPIASAEDLIVMKVLAGRPKDLDDVRAIVRVKADLDVPLVRETLALLERALDQSDLLPIFDGIWRTRP